jgi:hypothetical protein
MSLGRVKRRTKCLWRSSPSYLKVLSQNATAGVAGTHNSETRPAGVR